MINRRPSIWNKAACFVSAGVARTFECPPALNVHLHEHMSTFMSTARLYVYSSIMPTMCPIRLHGKSNCIFNFKGCSYALVHWIECVLY